MAKLKVIVFTIPASGHLNPLMPILKEMVNSGDYEVIVYLDETNKKLVESIGAQHRLIIGGFDAFHNFQKTANQGKNPNLGRSNIAMIIKQFYDIIYKNIENMARDIDREQPDLIIYDFFALYAKWVLRYYKTRYEIGKTLSSKKAAKQFCPKRPLPPIVVFSPSFAMDLAVYPNKLEMELRGKKEINYYISLIKIYLWQFKLCFLYGMKMPSILENTPMKHPDFVSVIMTCIVAEVQPRAHLFNEKIFKFIGSTVRDNFVDPRAEEEVFKNALSLIPVKNENELRIVDQSTSSVLIFASLGTIFNKSLETYREIINAFIEFDDETSYYKHSFLKSSNLKVIVSLGDIVYGKFQELINSGQFKVPENIILVKSAPQIEILKRASLFVTHSGMNSSSESIYYGVPMICIPMSADQPNVAYRIADELGLGIRLNKINLKSSDVRKAAHRILRDPSYYIRLKRFSEISRSYDGIKNSLEIISNLTNKKNL